jgi:hypothetical protein
MRSFDMILRGCLTFEPKLEQGKIVCHPSQIHNLMSSCYGSFRDVAGNIDQLTVSSKTRLPLPTLLGRSDFLLAHLKHCNCLHRNVDRDRREGGERDGTVPNSTKRAWCTNF